MINIKDYFNSHESDDLLNPFQFNNDDEDGDDSPSLDDFKLYDDDEDVDIEGTNEDDENDEEEDEGFSRINVKRSKNTQNRDRLYCEEKD
jgi:hypothetical protein